jgi:hypothetical protein
MARIGIAITKSTAFRDSVQEFSNVYYYENLAGLPSESEALGLIDELTAFEKTIHANDVTFVRGRCWSQVGAPSANAMLGQKALSGVGALTPDSALDKERAILIRIRAGVDSRGNPVYLRKWFHAHAALSGMGGAFAGSITANTTGFSQAQRDAAVTATQTMGAIGGGTEPWKLCAKSGRFPTAGAPFEAHKYLEHHQFGDMWRG